MNGLREQLETLRAEIVAGRYDNAVDWLDAAIRLLSRQESQPAGTDAQPVSTVTSMKEHLRKSL